MNERRAWLHETLDALRRFSSTSVGTTRLAFSPEFEAARDLVLGPFTGDAEFEIRDPGVRAAIRRAADALGEPAVDLVSLAGHDAMNMARLCPTGMFFVPSLGGLSHSPREASREADVELALDLLVATAAELGVVSREAIVRPPGRR